MTKKEWSEKIKQALEIFMADQDYTLTYRLEYLGIAITLTRDYIKEYKAPYKHEFMGSTIKFTEPMIDGLEEMLIKAIAHNDEERI